MPRAPRLSDLTKAVRLVAQGQVFQARSLLIAKHRVGGPMVPPIRAALGRLWELDFRARIRVLEALGAEAEQGRVDPRRLNQLRWLLARRRDDLLRYLGPKTVVAGGVAPGAVAMGAVEAEHVLIDALALEDRGDVAAFRVKIVSVVEATDEQLHKLDQPMSEPADLGENLGLLERQTEEVFNAWADYQSHRATPEGDALWVLLRQFWDREGLDALVEDILAGKWKEMKERVKEHWGRITDDELDRAEGKADQVIGLLQQRYGYSKERALEEFDRFFLRDQVGGYLEVGRGPEVAKASEETLSGKTRGRRRGSDLPGESSTGSGEGGGGGSGSSVLPGAGGAGSGGPGIPRTIRRTPHLDLSPKPPVTPDVEIAITVWADTKPPRKGEDVTPIDVEVPPEIQRIDLVAELLVSDHFEPVGDQSLPFPMEVRRDRTEPIEFRVRVRSEADLRSRFPDPKRAGRGGISVVFRYQGRPAGGVRVTVSVAISSGPAKKRAPASAPAAIAVNLTDQSADLIVQIKAEPEGDDTEFRCALRTSLISSYVLDKWHRWKLKRSAERIVRGYMKRFVDPRNDAQGRLGELRGAGLELFDAAPKEFRELFWQLVDARRLPRTIAIVTEEPFIPWELMIPNRGEENRLPLGVEFVIGRWVPLDDTSGPQRFALGRSLVIAPEYRDHRDLPNAKSEAAFVLGKVPGGQANPAVIESITASLIASECNLVHFVGHGSAGGGQSLDLEEGQTLTSTKVRGLANFRAAFAKAPTLVLLNACEVGRPAPALNGVGGLVQALIRQRAGGVIAALWSVEDSIAHSIAKEFYEEALKDPARPFADILRGIRARAYDELNPLEDTYAAYCFYGDPRACRG